VALLQKLVQVTEGTFQLEPVDFLKPTPMTPGRLPSPLDNALLGGAVEVPDVKCRARRTRRFDGLAHRAIPIGQSFGIGTPEHGKGR
jgi:hypothetical protein